MEAGASVGGRFEIERLAGAGGMGAVYRARDRETGELVALKMLARSNRDELARFVREAEILAELHHPAIVRYIAHGTDEESAPYLAMEWVEGETLSKRLTKGRLSVVESVALCRRIAEAVGVAHDVGIVHRDLKPANLLLEQGDAARPKVLDFGVARMRDRDLTLAGTVLGTPGYMAPEQARGEADVDARADVFALGCVLFRCLTGRPPFDGEDILAVLLKLILEEPPRLRDLDDALPDELESLVSRMLSKSKNARPSNGAALARELAALDPEFIAPRRENAAPRSLTRNEQRVLCLVLAERSRAPLDAPTLDGADPEVAAMTETTMRHSGSRFHRLLDGSTVLSFSTTGPATDQAALAARAALGLKARFPERAIVLSTGLGVITDALPVGQAIERASRMMRAAAGRGEGAVLLDEVTSGLLDARFVVTAREKGFELVAERAVGGGVRTLVGKATSCVGRDRELAMLTATVDDSRDEPAARAALITGSAGVGKTRLLHELLRRIELGKNPPVIWIARGDAMSLGAPFGLVAGMLRHATGVREGEPLATRRKKLLDRVALHVAPAVRMAVAEFLGEILSTPVSDDASVELRAARADPLLFGDRVLRAWLDFVEAESTARPLLLALDDLQWGDLPSLRVLDATLRVLREAPVVVFAAGRPEVEDLFPKLWVERDVLAIRLGELTRSASEKLCREVLGASADPAVVRRIAERASGNAFYLEELIRAVAEGRGDDLPETILAMVMARLEALPAEARRVLRAGSVFGQTFWRGGVSALLGGEATATSVSASLGMLEEMEIVSRRAGSRYMGEDEYQVRQDLVREAADAALTEIDRRVGHRLAASWLETVGERDAVLLAEHFEQGGDRGRAATLFRSAAQEALAANDLAGVLARAAKGLSCVADVGEGSEEVAGALFCLQATAHRFLGDLPSAEARALDALSLVVSGEPLHFTATGELAIVAGRLGGSDRVDRVLDLLRVTPASGARVAHALAAVRATNAMLQLGRYEIVDALLASVEAATDLASSDPAVWARFSFVRGIVALHEGDLGTYAERCEATTASFVEAGDLRSACSARGSLGHAHVELGNYREAEAVLRVALADATRLGLINAIVVALHNLGPALANNGALREAVDVESRAAAEALAHGDTRMEGGSRSYLALIKLTANDLDGAEREAREATRLLAVSPPILPFAIAVAARVLLARGDTRNALERAREASAQMDALGRVETGEALIRLTLAEALSAAGEKDAARAAIADAKARLIARADRIRRAEWRARFLDQVPENARTLHLADSM